METYSYSGFKVTIPPVQRHGRVTTGVDARRVVVVVQVRRVVCPTRGCRQTFREQLPGVLERYQRRTPGLSSQVSAVVRELADRATRG